MCIADSWPGQARTLYGDHDRFGKTYFSTFAGKYFTGDGARRDEDGYYWITGRVDDVINVSGHRLGTAEVESALVAHPKVAEAAVVGYPHDIKGTGIYAYVTLNVGDEPTEELRKELVQWVRREISPIAAPDLIQWAPSLPKTRSGKIMRRILRKIAANEHDQLGDTSTLADPGGGGGLGQGAHEQGGLNKIASSRILCGGGNVLGAAPVEIVRAECPLSPTRVRPMRTIAFIAIKGSITALLGLPALGQIAGLPGSPRRGGQRDTSAARHGSRPSRQSGRPAHHRCARRGAADARVPNWDRGAPEVPVRTRRWPPNPRE